QMYDIPALAAATDAWWQGLARHFRHAGIIAVPGRLTRSTDLASQLLAPNLPLSHTCGYPLSHALAAPVRVDATPRYLALGCDNPCYVSVILVAKHSQAASLADLAGATAIINGSDSQSGCNILRYMAATTGNGGTPLFGRVTISGGHMASIRAVARGQAD